MDSGIETNDSTGDNDKVSKVRLSFKCVFNLILKLLLMRSVMYPGQSM